VTPVPHVEHDRVRLDFRIDGHLVLTGPLGCVHGGLACGIEQGAQRLVQLAVPHHHDLHGDAVISLDLPLQQADTFAEHGGVLPDGTGRATLEEPGAQLTLLDPGEAHHLLGIVGRALNERQRLQHRVMDVGRHLGPFFGQRTRLALGDEVPEEAQPPRAEDHDTRRNDQYGATDGPERRHRRVTLDQ
jgi:hypothetical protein